MKKTVGITAGDPAGIGPEVIGRALVSILNNQDELNVSLPQFRLFGPEPVLDALIRYIGSAGFRTDGLVRAISTTPDLAGIETGAYSGWSGMAAMAALEAATDELVAGSISGLVTGPISKLAFLDAGRDFPGQTEFVADRFKADNWAMMLGGPRLKVALATTHVALRQVPDAITTDLLSKKIRVCDDFMKNHMGIESPTLAVTALNPHSGDGGKFGTEESDIIEPSINMALDAGINVTGPIPADTCFYQASKGQFDMVLAMYHDQGLAPLKLIHFSDAFNVTMGLPRIRCACDHGPAFDIAGCGLADHSSMKNAILFACGQPI